MQHFLFLFVLFEEKGQIRSCKNEHATPYSTVDQIDHIFDAVNWIRHYLHMMMQYSLT